MCVPIMFKVAKYWIGFACGIIRATALEKFYNFGYQLLQTRFNFTCGPDNIIQQDGGKVVRVIDIGNS
jgi:hypothetical protein